ncbi:MAG: hypothetical protein IJU66_06805 [Oscillospiraceae bacterium]|nr:hypothetical protein [Oscillospiraceae bacterium]
MKLYHYSVDSFQSGSELINDYKNQFRFAEPYLLALQRGEDCFWSVFFAGMSYSRELCTLGLRKRENYVKDAIEGIFEYVRRREFEGRSASRVGCVYYCESMEEAVAYLKTDCIDSGEFTLEQVKLLEVEVDDARVYRYDQSFFNRAEEIMETSRELSAVIELARMYFAQKRSDEPLIEILSDGGNHIVRECEIA